MAEKDTSTRRAAKSRSRRRTESVTQSTESRTAHDPAKPKRRMRRRAPQADVSVIETQTESEEAESPQPEADVPHLALRRQLIVELEELVKRLRALHPSYSAQPFSARGMLDMIEEGAEKVVPGFGSGLIEKARKFISEDLFDPDTWKGLLYMLNTSVESRVDVVRRRLTGEYETDEWGMDREYIEAVRPFFEFMYRKYWRVEMSGVENIPPEGRVLLVVNHSGQLPWDGAMLGTGVLLEHPHHRLVRSLYAAWFPTLPFLADLFVKMGQVLATDDNGMRLLEQDQLVAVYPEGYKGVGKLYKERYRLARFGRGGFVKMALKTRAPLIPVAVVGAEETYISLAKSNLMAKITGFPYFPISPTFPWTGLFGFVPLPTKWSIDIGAPILMDGYGANADRNLVLVSQLTDQMRNIVQEMIFARLAQRRSVFFG